MGKIGKNGGISVGKREQKIFDNINLQEKKKEILIQKLKKQREAEAQKDKEVVKKNSSEKEGDGELVKSLKKKIKELEKHSKKLEERIKDKTIENVEIQKKVTKLKNDLFQKDKDLISYKNREDSQNKQKIELTRKTNMLEQKLNLAQETTPNQRKLIKIIESLRKDNKSLLKKNFNLKKHNDNILSRNKNIEYIRREEYLNTNRGLNKHLMAKERKISELKSKMSELESKINELKDGVSLNSAIEIIKNRMNELNILNATTLGNIVAEFYTSKNRKKNLQEDGVKIPEEVFENTDFGYLIQRDDSWWFINLDNEKYPIKNTTETLENDAPVKVIIDENNQANVFNTYPIDHQITNIREYRYKKRYYHKKNKKTNQDTREIAPMVNFTVLLIGSRNMTDYRDHLAKIGLKVDLFNPYEENLKLIEGKYLAADVVIVCTSHTSHSALDHIDKDDKKVELIERDNKETIEARARFAAINLGIQKQENYG